MLHKPEEAVGMLESWYGSSNQSVSSLLFWRYELTETDPGSASMDGCYERLTTVAFCSTHVRPVHDVVYPDQLQHKSFPESLYTHMHVVVPALSQ